jgi:hypothetical protein
MGHGRLDPLVAPGPPPSFLTAHPGHLRDRSVTLPAEFHHLGLEGWCECPPSSSLLHRLHHR